MDNLKNFRRTNYCGDLRLGDTGKTVSLCGWVQRQRDLGGLIFVDLRDRTGLVQLSFDDGTDQAVFEKASSLRSEYVIAATGTVREMSLIHIWVPVWRSAGTTPFPAPTSFTVW